MRKLIRSPLTYFVAAEMVVVTALVMVAWSVVASAARPVVLSPSIAIPEPTAGDDLSLPDFPFTSDPPAAGAPPGLNINTGFWRARMAELNRDQAVLVRLEWRLVHAGMDALRRYLDSVVVPALKRAERTRSG
jgi:hypothetical protein